MLRILYCEAKEVISDKENIRNVFFRMFSQINKNLNSSFYDITINMVVFFCSGILIRLLCFQNLLQILYNIFVTVGKALHTEQYLMSNLRLYMWKCDRQQKLSKTISSKLTAPTILSRVVWSLRTHFKSIRYLDITLSLYKRRLWWWCKLLMTLIWTILHMRSLFVYPKLIQAFYLHFRFTLLVI